MLDERNREIQEVGVSGYFKVLKQDSRNNNAIIVPPEASNIVESMNRAEKDLNMANVSTVISTIVSLRAPNHDTNLISEKLLEFTDGPSKIGKAEMKKLRDLRDNFYRQRDLLCIGKVVPNQIRD